MPRYCRTSGYTYEDSVLAITKSTSQPNHASCQLLNGCQDCWRGIIGSSCCPRGTSPHGLIKMQAGQVGNGPSLDAPVTSPVGSLITVPIFPYPPSSPNVSPIEPLWKLLKKHVRTQLT